MSRINETRTMATKLPLLQPSKSYDESLGLWDSFDNGDEDDALSKIEDRHQSMIDGVDDEDFLMMEVSASADDNDAWSLMDGEDEGAQIEKLPSFYHEEPEAPRTPSPAGSQAVLLEGSSDLHQITPEQQAPPKISILDSTELQIKYQRTLQQLAKSMRRSDETRCIVKRQRMSSPDLREEDNVDDFFSSSRATAIEESRQKLYKMIHTGVLSV